MAQEINRMPVVNLETFDRKELADSSFHSIKVYRYIYSLGDTTVKPHLFYAARFNEFNKITFEIKNADENDSTVSVFEYDDSNNLSKIIIEERNYYGLKRTIEDYLKNGKIKYSESFATKYKDSVKINYFYDERQNLIKEEKLTGDRAFIRLYKYNETDSIIRETMIDKVDNKEDSIIICYDYNNSGRLIRKTQSPSITFFKTYDSFCRSGSSYKKEYTYDSLGQRIQKYDSGYDIRRAYSKVKYNENGFIEYWYDTKDILTETNVYNYYHYYSENQTPVDHFLRESFNEASRITSYLSEKSKLPDVINYSPNIYVNITFIFEYAK